MGTKSNKVSKLRAELRQKGIIVEVPEYNVSIPDGYNFTFTKVTDARKVKAQSTEGAS